MFQHTTSCEPVQFNQIQKNSDVMNSTFEKVIFSQLYVKTVIKVNSTKYVYYGGHSGRWSHTRVFYINRS